MCRPGGYGERLLLRWIPSAAGAYVSKLLENSEMDAQFLAALEEQNVDKSCFFFFFLIVQAASEPDVGMACRQSVCSRQKNTEYRPAWFDAECATLKHACDLAVRYRAGVHEFKPLLREYRRVTQRARRAFIIKQRDEFFFRLTHNDPSVHNMLRKPEHPTQTPITAAAWEEHLCRHFGSSIQRQQLRREQQQQQQQQQQQRLINQQQQQRQQQQQNQQQQQQQRQQQQQPKQQGGMGGVGAWLRTRARGCGMGFNKQ